MTTRKFYRLLILVGFLLLSFGSSWAQTTSEVCNDGIDNDGDGKIDCADTDCAAYSGTPKIYERGCDCFDNIDNDGDGAIDKADGNCASYYGLTYQGNGTADCSVTPPGALTPFTGLGAPSTSSQNTADTQSKVAVGDVDGDGIPDAIITSKWNAEVRVIATKAHTVSGTSYAVGDVKSDWKLTGQGAQPFSGTGDCNPKNLLFEHEVLIADINKDKKAEIFTVVSNRRGNPDSPPNCFFLVGYTYTKATLTMLPGYPVQIGPDRPGTFGIADMDGDGKAELYLRDRIFAAENGTLLASEGAKTMNDTGLWDSEVSSGPVAVNVTGDNKMELIVGTKIYTIPTITGRSPASPSALTLFKDMNSSLAAADKAYVKLMNDPVEYGIDTHSSNSVADFDGDGFIDVFFSGAKGSTTGRTAIFYWNVQKNTVTTVLTPSSADMGYTAAHPDYTNYLNGWIWGPGRINLGDPTGDGRLDLSFMAGNQLFCVTSDGTAAGLKTAWTQNQINITGSIPLGYRTINDSRSGVLTCTVYDFNNDGRPELVYRDSQELVVVDGPTGLGANGSSSPKQIWSTTCQSHTYTEGPVIADVNGDGATDICVTCNTNNSFSINDGIQQQALGQIRLYFSNNNSWLPTRKVWNQPGYFVVNINDNLTLPFPQLDQNLIFGTTPCFAGQVGPVRPLNVFLNQVPNLGANGCPIYPAPDLTFFGDVPNVLCNDADPSNDPPGGCDSNGDGKYLPAIKVTPPICGDLPIGVQFNIQNAGDLPITDNMPVSFFDADPRLNPPVAKRLDVKTLPLAGLGIDATYSSPTYTINSDGKAFTLYIVLYNTGPLGLLTSPVVLTGQTNECSISNNIYSTPITPDPFTVTVEKVADNFKCANASPDTGSLRARVFKSGVEQPLSDYSFQWYTGTTSTSPIAGATNATVTGLAEGTYSVIVTNVAKGCTSNLVSGSLVRIGSDPTITLTVVSDQTKCSPSNGEIRADITGGIAGYTFKWYNEVTALPINITTQSAAGLTKGTYYVEVSSADGCTKKSPNATIAGPSIADATGVTISNVVDCSTPLSGSVSVDAYFNGVLQPAANYNYTWYKYDAANNPAQGTSIPGGTTQTIASLAVGSYQAVLEDKTTKCTSTSTPATVSSSVVIPVASIAQLAAQTSCDPTKPNGALQASASATGFTNPTDFTFEWFRGDNTLAANKIPIAGGPETVSGTKGEILNSAKGGGIIYTVKITTPLNCTATEKTTVNESINVPVVTLAQLTPNSVCDAAKATNPYNGSIKATVTFGVDGSNNPISVTLPDPNYQFSWYDGTTTTTAHTPAPADLKNPVLSALKDGDYAVTVTRTDLFCTSVPKTVPVTKATVLPILSATSTGSNNCDATLTPDGTVTVSVTNIVAGDAFTYQWYDGNAVGVGALGAANNGTTATAIKVGGPVGAPKPYTVEVLNTATGCVNNTTQFVADNSVIPVLGTSTTPNANCDPTKFSGTMTATLSNPVAGYSFPADFSFEWFTGSTDAVANKIAAPVTSSTASDITLTKLDAGTYTVKAKNTKTGCQSSPFNNTVANNKVTPTLVPSSTGSNNCDNSLTPDGTASVVASASPGAPASYSYQWYTGSGNPITTPLTAIAGATNATVNNVGGPTGAPKSYTVFVTDLVTGCTNFTTASVADVSVVPVIATSTTPNQNCDPTKLSGTMTATWTNSIAGYSFPADFTFDWYSDATGTSIIASPTTTTAATSITLTKLDVGPYSVKAKNTKTGCISALANNNVGNTKVFPTVAISQTSSTNCVEGNITPVAGGTTFTINPDGTATASVSNTGAGAGQTPGPFTYEWYDAATATGGIIGNAANITGLKGYPNGTLPNPAVTTRSYTVRVKDNTTGCSTDQVGVISHASSLPVFTTATTPNQNCDPTKFVGTMTVTLSNTQPAGSTYSYVWYDGNTTATAHSPASNTATLSSLDAGTYSMISTNNVSGCASVLVTDMVNTTKVFPSVLIATTSSTNCVEGNITPVAGGTTFTINPDGTATASVSNTGAGAGQTPGPFTYEWYDAATATGGIIGNAANITGLKGYPNGTLPNPAVTTRSYTVRVKDNTTGCSTDQVGVISHASSLPVFTTATTPNQNCDPTKFVGTMTVTLSNTQPAGSTYSYVWYDGNTTATAHSPASNTATLSSLDAGTYSMISTNNVSGCASVLVTDIVNTSKVFPSLAPSSTGSHNCDEAKPADGTASVAVSVTTGSHSFQWYSGTGDPRVSPLPGTLTLFSGTGATTNSISGVGGPTGAPKPFTVLVTNDASGCASYATANVADVSRKPTFPLTPTDNKICQLNVSGAGTSPTAYDGHVDFGAIANNFQGTYSGTVTYSYSWSNIAGGTPVASSPTNGTSSLTQLDNGTYGATVTITELGCTSDQVTAEVKDAPVPITMTVTVNKNTNCTSGGVSGNGLAEVTGVNGGPADANFLYDWYNGGTVSGVSIKQTALLGNTLVGPSTTYTAQVTSKSTGCTVSQPITIVDDPVIPTISVALGQNNGICDPFPTKDPNGSLIATIGSAGTNFTITWSGAAAPATQTTTTITGDTYSKLAAGGPYSAFVKNNDTGCKSLTDTGSILDAPVYPTPTVTVTDQTSCTTPNGKLAVTVVAGITYSWFDDVAMTASHSQTSIGSGIIDALDVEDYTLKAEVNLTGCKTVATYLVAQKKKNPDLTATPFTAANCAAPDGKISFTQTDLANANSFSLWVLKETGNSSTTDKTVLQVPANFKAANSNTSPIPDLTNLVPGYYTAIIRDGVTNCDSQPVTVNVNEPNIPSIVIDGVAAGTSCGVGSTGGISVTVSGGTGPFVYEWYKAAPINTGITFIAPVNLPNMNGAGVIDTNEDLAGVGTGTYTFIVKDSKGCGNYFVESVPALLAPTVTVTTKNNTQCDPGQNGEIKVTLVGTSGVSAPFSVGSIYTITNIGTTDFTLIGAASNTVGVTFTATGPGAGTGTANVNYSISLYKGNDPLTASIVGGSLVTGNGSVNNDYTGLKHDEYLIKIDDGNSPPCPIYKGYQIDQVAFNPVVDIDIVQGNTSCTPATSADGSIKVTVSSDPDPKNATNAASADFVITSITAAPSGAYAAGLGTGGNVTITGFKPTNYSVVVTDNYTTCKTNKSFTMNDEQEVPDDLILTPTAEDICSNVSSLSNGKATATISGGEATSHFTFAWASTNTLASPFAYTGDLLNLANATSANWPMGATTGYGNGNRTYYAQATKIDYAPGTGIKGVGCKTGIVQVTILDQPVSPDMTLTSSFDTFCSATAGNNQIGDGKITIVADAIPTTGAQDFPAAGFDYSWTPVPVGAVPGGTTSAQVTAGSFVPGNKYTITSIGTTNYTLIGASSNTVGITFTATGAGAGTGTATQTSTAASYVISQLHDGSYTVTTMNATNKCIVSTSATVDSAPYVVTISKKEVIDQRICNNDGWIKVTEVKVDNSATGTNLDTVTDDGISGAGVGTSNLASSYDFEWYTSPTLTTKLDGVSTTPITAQILSNDSDRDVTVDENGDYTAMKAGTYYVVARRKNPALIGLGCASLPATITVLDKHVNPVPVLTALSDTSCGGTAEGEIKIVVTDASPSFFNLGTSTTGWTYTYTWSGGAVATLPGAPTTGNGDGANGAAVPVGDKDNYLNLEDSTTPYTVAVKNNQTGCTVNANATVPKNETPVFVQSVTIADQYLCNPDGSLTVTKVTLNDRTGTSTDFVPVPVGLQGNINNFTFDWTRGASSPQTTAGNALTTATYNAGTLGAPGIGAGSYTVVATRNTGAPGNGCKSAAFPMTIQNKSVNPVVTLTPFSNTSCTGNFEGEITVKVTDATDDKKGTGASVLTTPYSYSYDWTTSQTTGVINGPVAGVNDGDDSGADGDGDNPKLLKEGLYTLKVTNPQTGCNLSASTTIIKNSTPVFVQNVTIADQYICNPDGSLTVTKVTLSDRNGVSTDFVVGPGAGQGNINNFTFDWTRGASGPQTTAGNVLNSGNYSVATLGAPGIGAGTYSVITTRVTGSPGNGCQSAPVSVTIQNKSVNPVVTLTPFSNTSCTGTFEGEITVKVTDATDDKKGTGASVLTTPYSYSYNWLQSATLGVLPLGAVAVPATHDGDQSAADGDGDNPKLLQEGVYELRATNPQTGCFASATTTIIKNSAPVFVQNVTIADQYICNPDGSLTVTKVTVSDRNGVSTDFVVGPGAGQGNINNFSFDWSRGASGPQTTAGNVLNSGNYSVATLGAPGIGAGTYSVITTRVTGSPGNGCQSAPVSVTIQNKSVNPVVTLTPFSNTSCTAAFEGEITVKVTDATDDKKGTGASVLTTPYSYSYNWLQSATLGVLPLGAVAVPATHDGDNSGADGDGDNPKLLQEGVYELRATNPQTGCFASGTATIIKNATPVFVQSIDIVDQLICNADGSLTVTKVSLNDRTGASKDFVSTPGAGQGNISDFDFEWTRGGVGTLTTTGASGNLLNAASYVAPLPGGAGAIGAGDYTITAVRKVGSPGAGCKSAPSAVKIQDKSINPVVQLTPIANTSCDPTFFEGEILVKVTDATTKTGLVTPYAYSYNWTVTQTPGVINGAVAGTHNGDQSSNGGTDGDNPKALKEGSYELTVTNPQTGCSSKGTTTLFKNGTPVFTQLVNSIPQIFCTADGSLTVNEVRIIDRTGATQSNLNGDFPLSNFNFIYEREISSTATVVLPQSAATTLNSTNYITPGTQSAPAGIGFGTYYVTTKRVTGFPGKDCSSAPYKIDIADKRIFPSVALKPFANTSCSGNVIDYEGEIEVTVTDGSVSNAAHTLTNPFSYTYNWTKTATPTVISGAIAGTHDGDASNADSDGDNPINLKEGDYELTATNTQTGCSALGSTTIYQNSTPVFTQLVSAVPQVVCNPDGSLAVNEVRVIDRDGNTQKSGTDFPMSNFQFTYSRTTIGNTVLANSGNAFLNSTNYPAIGFDSYYVVSTRVVGGPGKGCSSAPYKVDIEDKRLFPKVSFTSTANSSCNSLKPNGSLTAIAAEQNGTQTNPYTFSWTLNGSSIGPLAPNPTQSDATPKSVLTNAIDGDYIVTATNTVTGCPFSGSFTLRLDQTRSTPNIIAVDVTKPLDCNPSATAEVTKITLGSGNNSSLIPPQANNEVTGAGLLAFNYEWYQGTTNAADRVTKGGPALTTPCIGPSCATPTAGVAAGTYFVFVVDPTTDCKSGPKEVVVDDDNIIYPVINLIQTKKQVSCIGTTGTAELQATASEDDGSTGTSYNFTWYPSLNLTGTAIAAPSVTNNPNTISNLVVGNYSVEVLNTVSNCKSSSFYVVPDEAPAFTPQVSVSTTERTFCVGQDGGVAASVLNLDPQYPFPYTASTYTADLYAGNAASGTPIVTAMPFVTGSVTSFQSFGLGDGPYTVKVKDNNTGCSGVATGIVKDNRQNPVVTIKETNPMTTCDPVIANGQLEALANGKFIGYSFDWFTGSTIATPAPAALSTGFILLGKVAGPYVVRATDLITGCFADKDGKITDKTVIPPVPNPEVLRHRTSCIVPNGEVSVTVGGVTVNYSFNWYNGSAVKATADITDFYYPNRDIGKYTVTATDVVTRCVSPPATVEVLDERYKPEFTIATTASYCSDVGKPAGIGSVEITLTNPMKVALDNAIWTLQGTTSVVGAGPAVYELFPGFYHVVVTSTEGCVNEGDAEVKTEINPYNGISSNGDGQNDAFIVDCITNFPNNNVKIFNRSGILVYEMDGYNNADKSFRGIGLDGLYLGGKELPVGTYFYIVDKRDGSKPVAGYLELDR